MTYVRRNLGLALLLIAGAAVQAQQTIPLVNWPVGSWPEPDASPTRRMRVQAHGDITPSGTKFVAVTPCRLVDTRDPNGAFGGPAYAAGEARTYQLPSHPICTGLPSTALAYSLNFTIVNYNVNAGSYVVGYPAGTTKPYTSTVTFGSGPAVSNSAIVTGTSGGISVYAGGATHVIIDINGYFIGSRVKPLTNTSPGNYRTALVGVRPVADAATGGSFPFTIHASGGTAGTQVALHGTYLHVTGAGNTCRIDPAGLVQNGAMNVACSIGFCTAPGVADSLHCFSVFVSGLSFTPTVINVTFDVTAQPGSQVYLVP